MSNINGINNSFRFQPLKHRDQSGDASKSKGDDQKISSGENTTLQINKMLIDMQLKVSIETKQSFEIQASIVGSYETTTIDLSQFMHNGKPVTDLSQEEAQALVSDGGYFSIENTAQRIFDFAVQMAGGDPERLTVTRDAVLKGFKEAEEVFGGSLPEISYKTIDKALGMLDEKIREGGGSVINLKA